MLVISSARTAPNRAVRFGMEDVPLDPRGCRDAAALVGTVEAARVLVGPEESVRQTAELIGLRFDVDERLRSLDLGHWSGVSPDDVDPDDLRSWFTDVTWTGHGGESVVDFVSRITSFAAGCGADALVVAKPVAQALLADSAGTFFRVEVRPATVAKLPSTAK